MTGALTDFHFLRPLWLGGLAPFLYLLWRLWRHDPGRGVWQQICDTALIPFVVTRGASSGQPRRLAPLIAGGVCALVALAGPTFERLPQPVFRDQAGLVILLDLSLSMNARDIVPSRLERARFKIKDLLADRLGGQTALVVFAAQPFTVTPLTDDVATIQAQLSILSPNLMPRQGSDIPRAVQKGVELLTQAGFTRGDLLLITDGVDVSQLDPTMSNLKSGQIRLSVLGVGTVAGAPIPNADGGFISDANGGIVLSKLEQTQLMQLATRGHGYYQTMTTNSDDVAALNQAFAATRTAHEASATQIVAEQWRELGPWLMVPVLLCAMFAFRRGLIIGIVAWLAVSAPDVARADWWATPDQAGSRAFAKQDYATAAQRFATPTWRAAAEYRAGNYDAALSTLEQAKSDNLAYNKGNTLARLGRYTHAIDAYDEALKLNPNDEDAKYNRELLQKIVNQQHPDAEPEREKDRQQQPPQDDRAEQNQGKEGDDGQRQAKGAGRDTQLAPPSTEKDKAKAQAQKDQQKAASASRQNSTQDESAANAAADQQQRHARRGKSAQDAQAEAETKLATEQWLRQIPDDPGGLLRRKFEYQYGRTYRDEAESDKPW